jgi:DNA-binding NarL/FixJ family response regulator
MVPTEIDREYTIVMADDHEVVRAGLRRLISIDKKFHIVAEAENGSDAVQLVAQYNPDIVMLDILMPFMDGIEATVEIKEKFPDMIVVMLTAYEDSQHIEKAMAAGANGYLTKDISAHDLVLALNNVLSGERVFSKTILQLLTKKSYSYQDNDSTPINLTKREQEILMHVVQGKTSTQIADALFLSVRTVQTHRANIMQKLGVKNAAGLVRHAMLGLDKIKNLLSSKDEG